MHTNWLRPCLSGNGSPDCFAGALHLIHLFLYGLQITRKDVSDWKPSFWNLCMVATPTLISQANCGSWDLLLQCDRFLVGREGFEPPKATANRFTVCPFWPLTYLPILKNNLQEPADKVSKCTNFLPLFRYILLWEQTYFITKNMNFKLK